jgi:preprotein translocase subunit SecA
MTGTAETEAKELWDIYKLDVVAVKTNKPLIRDDQNDLVYKTAREKYQAIIEEIEKIRSNGRPVLVGTTSVEVSELFIEIIKVKEITSSGFKCKIASKRSRSSY